MIPFRNVKDSSTPLRSAQNDARFWGDAAVIRNSSRPHRRGRLRHIGPKRPNLRTPTAPRKQPKSCVILSRAEGACRRIFYVLPFRNAADPSIPLRFTQDDAGLLPNRAAQARNDTHPTRARIGWPPCGPQDDARYLNLQRPSNLVLGMKSTSEVFL